MKKFLVILLVLLIAVPVFAGQKRNIFASWYSVDMDTTTITLPSEVIADIQVINGDPKNVICVDLSGQGLDSSCKSKTGRADTTQLYLGQSLELYDYVTSGLQLITTGSDGTASSPISVIIAY